MPCPWKCSRPGCGLEQPDLMNGIPDCVSGVGLDDLYGLLQPKPFHDFMILSFE